MNSHSTVQPYYLDRTDIANYGPNERPHDAVADFLLGGNRKRLIIERLAVDDGESAADLIRELAIGRATVFEVIRALRSAGALDELDDARYRLSKKKPLGRALRNVVAALERRGDEAVDRPPRPRSRKRKQRRGR